MKDNIISNCLRDQSGVVAVVTAIALVMFLSFVALAVDVGHLTVTKNELQNAADAGALAGARMLYNSDGTVIQESANQYAYDAAVANLSQKTAVEVNWTSGNNTGTDVERGHWSFATRTFTPVDSTLVTPLNGKSAAELDVDTSFVNAVQVTVHRQSTPIISFFAGIMGWDSFQQSATACGWIGFAGSFKPGELDLPIALCEEFLGIPFVCGIAVMYEANETAMWTNMDQPDQNNDGTWPNTCNSADANEVTSLINSGNTEEVFMGVNMGVINGVTDVAFQNIITRWEQDNGRDKIWQVTLPVVSCINDIDGTEENTCATLTGGVQVDLIWIARKENKEEYEQIPDVYYKADGTSVLFDVSTTGLVDDGSDEYYEAKWDSFATALGLIDENGDTFPLSKKQVYFRASCDPAEISGGPGGENYGLLSQWPVLVN